MKLEAQCPFGSDYICVEGYRYKQVPGLSPSDIAKPLPQDMDGLLFSGMCMCCVKATGGGPFRR